MTALTPLLQERRQEMGKMVAKLSEDGKVAIRNVRRDAVKQACRLPAPRCSVLWF